MPTAQLFTDDLLDPISADQPSGVNLRWTAEWDRIKEARRADDNLDAGKWAKKERKTADWLRVQELATSMLQEQSKDLQLTMWLTEANVKLHGFAGLRDGLRLTRELMVRYWDQGLFPPIEDGPEDRAGPLQWLNDKLVDSIVTVPITVRSDQGHDFNFIELQDARRVGSEAGLVMDNGEIDPLKKKAYQDAVTAGLPSMEMFERALKETKRDAYEDLHSDFQQTHHEFQLLEKVIEEKFGDVAPVLSACRTVLREIKQEIEDILAKKRAAEPDLAPALNTQGVSEFSVKPASVPETVRFPISLSAPKLQGTGGGAGSWQEAEAFLRSGQVDQGLAQMARLAASETSGRDRFERKLLLAEVCLASNRERLARSILEELAEQIDKFQLELWERSELIGSVWTRLYRLYKQSEGGTSEAALAGKLYERLCRLDPWQALGCG